MCLQRLEIEKLRSSLFKIEFTPQNHEFSVLEMYNIYSQHACVLTIQTLEKIIRELEYLAVESCVL